VINLEGLEIRTPLSAGLGTSVAAHGAAFAPVPDQAATTIVQGPPRGLFHDGPATEVPAAPGSVQGDLPVGLPVFGPGGPIAFPIGGAELGREAAWDATGPSASATPSWPGVYTTREGSSPFAAYPEGFQASASAAWLGDFTQPNASREFSAYSSWENDFFVSNTGLYGPVAAPAWTLTVEIVVWVGAGPMTLDGSAPALAPGTAMDFSSRYDMPSPLFATESSGPASGIFNLEGGIASAIARDTESRLGTNGNDVETAFAASGSSTQASAISPLQMMAIPVAGGRTASGTSLPSGGGLSASVSSVTESIGAGWTSYIASGDLSSAGMYQPSLSLSDGTSAADNVGEPISPAAIAAGGIPLGVLLAGPESPAPPTSNDLQQVAELIPPDESSLALVATLWTVPSDVPTGASWVQRLDAGPAGLTDAAATPSWASYVIGLDQALEQSHRHIQQVVSPAQGRLMPDERDQLEHDRQLEWERPIMPATTGWVPDRREKLLRDTSLVGSDAIDALAADRVESAGGPESSRSGIAGDDAQARSDRAPFVQAGTIPLLWALSASTAITGWLWTRRNRKRRIGLPGLAGRSG